MPRRQLRPTFLLALTCIVVLAACGGGGSSEPSARTKAAREKAAKALQFRPVLIIGPCAEDSDTSTTAVGDPTTTTSTAVDDASTTTTAETTPTTTSTTDLPPITTTTALGDPGEQQDSLGSVGLSDGETASAGQLAPTTAAPGETTTPPPTTTTLPEGSVELTSPDQQTCYTLGPIQATGEDLTSAKLTSEPSIGVTVEAAPESVDKLNRMFNACFNGEATCPPFADGHGQIAMVSKDLVISAPTVNAPNLADDAFTISGTFTMDEAIALGKALGG